MRNSSSLKKSRGGEEALVPGQENPAEGGRATLLQRTVRFVVVLWSAAGANLLASAPARGELRPAECVVIYNSQSEASGEIARYYAAKRGIREDHLLGIALPQVETLDRRKYEAVVRPAVRAYLSSAQWGDTIRCLVTCYDTPLRIAKRHTSEEQRRRGDELEAMLVKTYTQLRDLVDRIRAADDGPADPATPPQEAGLADVDHAALKAVYDTYHKEQDNFARRQAGLGREALIEQTRKMFTIVQLAEGTVGVMRRVQVNPEAMAVSADTPIELVIEKLEAAERRIDELVAYGSSPSEFDEAIPLIRQTRGLFGLAGALQNRIHSLRGEDSASSFDSELALVLSDEYDPAGWQRNVLHHKAASGVAGGAAEPPHRTLMVARLDAPTPELVRRMIDVSIETEATGLSGTFYIDTRGKGVKGDEGMIKYDQDLIELARLVRAHTKMRVVLDLSPMVFQIGECPNAALYCGWYSLANYVDAFDFVPGAIGVHIASFELKSLRDPGKKYWCKELLKDGAAATFGPTDEPYLQSFPMPTEFFGKLLTGRYTLAEAFSQTLPYHSWRLALVGDPLYNPFRNNPQLAAEWKR